MGAELLQNAASRIIKKKYRNRRDRRHQGVIIEKRKSHAFFDIVNLIRLNVITADDLYGFSEDLIEEVKMVLSR